MTDDVRASRHAAASDRMVTAQVADFIQSGMALNAIPKNVVDIAKRSIIDTIAVTVAGAGTAPSRLLQSVQPHVRAGQGRVVATSVRTSLPTAALVNGTMAHALDFDDFDPVGHPSAPVVSALIAACGDGQVSGRDLIEAYLVGVELQMRIGAAMLPAHSSQGWHPTATLGTLGACAAVSRMRGLNAKQTAHALGIAASAAGGLRKNFGTMTKPLHVGLAARGGLEAVLLAESGFTANEEILDERLGFPSTFGSTGEDVAQAAAALGQDLAILDPGLSIKRYPACAATHCAIEAVLELREVHRFEGEDVAFIECHASPGTEDSLLYAMPTTGIAAKFSMQYCVAAAAFWGRVDLPAFGDERVRQPEVRDLMSRSTLLIDPKIKAGPFGWSTASVVRIGLQNGEVLEASVEEPIGSPRRPVDDNQLFTKFLDCVNDVVPAPSAETMFAQLRTLEALPAIELALRPLFDRTSPGFRA